MAVDKCNDINALLSGMQGDGSTDTTYPLLQRTSKGQFLVSAYAGRSLSQKVDSMFLVLARNVNQGNDVFDDWILEMDFLIKIRKGHVITLFDAHTDQVSDIWEPLVRQVSFDKPEDLETIETGWLVPKRWNQGGYDAVRVEIYHGALRATFVQITRAGKHSFNARFVNAMMKVIANKHLGKVIAAVFFFVHPRGEAFSLPAFADHRWNTQIFQRGFERTGST